MDLWDVVEGENPIKKRDRQVMSIMFNAISDEISCQLDMEKTAKQTWQTLIP